MILTHTEVVELTGRRVKSAQVRVLRFMGIEHKLRPDGSVAVLRAHVDQAMGAHDNAKRPVEFEPNWSAM
jgi:hypothetical protein